MKIGIIGAGAMGSLLGFYLCKEADVWLLDPWQEHVEAINRNGLLRELNGSIEKATPHATTDPAEIGPCDLVLILVKAHQTSWAAEQASPLLRREAGDGVAPLPSNHPIPLSASLVVTLQNGVGNRERLADLLGESCVGQGVTSLGATLLGLGQVRHAGQGVTVFETMADHTGMAALAKLFNACGLPAALDDNLDSLVWGKLVVNVGINALTALLRVPNGALAEVGEARRLVERAVAEAVAVAAARGTPLPFDDPLAYVLHVAQATGANRSSMLQDVLRNSPTEIATINGAIVNEGHSLGIPTPVNEMLTLLVQAIDGTGDRRV